MESFWDVKVPLGTALLAAVALLVVVFLIVELRIEKVVSARTGDWEMNRMASERNRLEGELRKDYDYQLRDWKSQYATRIRQDAIARSKSVIAGRVAENIVPFLPIFPFNPKDARFLGSPVDFVIFDGLDEGNLREIVFLEMKTAASRVTSRQKAIKETIDAGNVFWQVLRLNDDTVDEALPDVLYDDIT